MANNWNVFLWAVIGNTYAVSLLESVLFIYTLFINCKVFFLNMQIRHLQLPIIIVVCGKWFLINFNLSNSF